MFCFTLFGFAMIGMGLLSFFNRDFMWSWQQFQNRMQGQVSERTETWENTQNVIAVVNIVIGIILLCWSISAPR